MEFIIEHVRILSYGDSPVYTELTYVSFLKLDWFLLNIKGDSWPWLSKSGLETLVHARHHIRIKTRFSVGTLGSLRANFCNISEKLRDQTLQYQQKLRGHCGAAQSWVRAEAENLAEEKTHNFLSRGLCRTRGSTSTTEQPDGDRTTISRQPFKIVTLTSSVSHAAVESLTSWVKLRVYWFICLHLGGSMCKSPGTTAPGSLWKTQS